MSAASRAAQIAADADRRVSTWPVVDSSSREALIERLRDVDIRPQQSGGYSIWISGEFHRWCPHMDEVRTYLDPHDRLIAALTSS